MNRVGHWSLRASIGLLGLALLAGAGTAAFVLAPGELGPEPGEETTYTEEISYWTPEDGWQQGLRERVQWVEATASGLRLVERLGQPASPRGASFHVAVDEGFSLLDEHALHASVPPTPYLQDKPERVYLAVPWQTSGNAATGAIDNMTLINRTVREGVDLMVYHAEHPDQFFVEQNGPTWFRAVERTTVVEPLTGTVVDYAVHETLWRQVKSGPGLPNLPGVVDTMITEREPVWEASYQATPATQAAQLQTADQARGDHHLRMAYYGLPLLLLGELALFVGATGWWVPAIQAAPGKDAAS